MVGPLLIFRPGSIKSASLSSRESGSRADFLSIVSLSSVFLLPFFLSFFFSVIPRLPFSFSLRYFAPMVPLRREFTLDEIVGNNEGAPRQDLVIKDLPSCLHLTNESNIDFLKFEIYFCDLERRIDGFVLSIS